MANAARQSMSNPLLADPFLATLPQTLGVAVLDRFAVLDRIAEGAQGNVYRGVHLDLQIAVAIKVQHAPLARQAAHRERFLDEARAGSQVAHANLVRVFQVGSHREVPYLVSELVPGVPLGELLVRRGRVGDRRLPVVDAVWIGLQIAAGLAALHRHGVVHRDVKPGNILVCPDGSVRLSDLGVLKRLEVPGGTMVGDMLGTPPYAAPEQLLSPATIDKTVDVYATALVLFLLLTGEEPWAVLRGVAEPRSLGELMARTVDVSALRQHLAVVGVGDELIGILATALAAEPGSRQADAAELKRQLGRWLRAAPGRPTPPAELATPAWPPMPEIRGDVLAAAARLGAGRPAEPLVVPEEDTTVLLQRLRPSTLRLPPGFGPASGTELVGGLPRVIEHVGTGLRLRLVPAGVFAMGCDDGNADEAPAREARISRPFWLGETPVTQRQWLAAGHAPCGTFAGEELPIENVDWQAAAAFCEALGGRLPSEAEWEYACRAGGGGRWAVDGAFGADLANYDARYAFAGCLPGAFLRKTTPVRHFRPNAWGFHDMHGNVFEWCADTYAAEFYSARGALDPCNRRETGLRAARGGGYLSTAHACRAASRLGRAPQTRASWLGFRLAISALELPAEAPTS